MTSQEVKKVRIAVMGPSNVGKTQFVNRIINNSFDSAHQPTVKETVFRKAYNLKVSPES